MPFQITPDNENLFIACTGARDSVRASIAYGVYPNTVKALVAWDNLQTMLESAPKELTEYHYESLGVIATYIQPLRHAMQSLVEMLEAAELAQPGVFGITAEVHSQEEPQ